MLKLVERKDSQKYKISFINRSTIKCIYSKEVLSYLIKSAAFYIQYLEKLELLK